MTGTEHSKLNIGFIGMGHMGSHMVPKPDQFDSNTPQTAGMRRSSAVSKQLAKGKLYTDKISTLGRRRLLPKNVWKCMDLLLSLPYCRGFSLK